MEEFDVSFSANGLSFELKLQQNRALIDASAKHMLVRADGSMVEWPKQKACYYLGIVVGDPTSIAGVSTCGGLAGIIIAHGRMVSTEPSAGTNFDAGAFGEDAPFGVVRHLARRLTDEQILDFQADVARFVNGAHLSQSRRLTGTATKYVEAFVVKDHRRFIAFGVTSGLTNLAAYSVSVLNSVTAIYKQAPAGGTSFPHTFQVMFLGQQTLVETDPWESTVTMKGAETDCSSLLGLFDEWGQDRLVSGQAGVTYDNRILLSGRDFDGNTVGLAGVSTMCRMPNSGNINMCAPEAGEVAGCGAVVAHEMCHNFGMHHDSSGNACPQSGFIMEAIFVAGAASTTFSSCSVAYIMSYFFATYPANGQCLENLPTTVEGDPICGNGFVERGEACDCGSGNCATLDPCCNSATCQLANANYQCAGRSGSCCESCMFVPAASNKACRAVVNECDLAETYPGNTTACPKEDCFYPGKTCTREGYSGWCYGGRCESLNATCSVDIDRYFDGNWDLTKKCASFVDTCGPVVCHNKDLATKYSCRQFFTAHGKSIRAAEGQPCWFPNTARGTRIGQCSGGEYKLPFHAAFVPVCGNGCIHFGEEYDCGSATSDSCCVCSTCNLKANMQCSSTDACFSSSCIFKASSEVCRAAVDSCDLQETCSGTSDHGQQWGAACAATDGGALTCYGKVCLDSLNKQCNEIWSAAKPFGDLLPDKSTPNPFGSCEALSCCSTCETLVNTYTISSVRYTIPGVCDVCEASVSSTSFTDADGKTNTMQLKGAIDGTVLNDRTKFCINAEAVTPQSSGSCTSSQFLSYSVGKCLACSFARNACTDPSHFDCTGDCKYGKDTRGACAVSAGQATLATQAATTAAPITTAAGGGAATAAAATTAAPTTTAAGGGAATTAAATTAASTTTPVGAQQKRMQSRSAARAGVASWWRSASQLGAGVKMFKIFFVSCAFLLCCPPAQVESGTDLCGASTAEVVANENMQLSIANQGGDLKCKLPCDTELVPELCRACPGLLRSGIVVGDAAFSTSQFADLAALHEMQLVPPLFISGAVQLWGIGAVVLGAVLKALTLALVLLTAAWTTCSRPVGLSSKCKPYLVLYLVCLPQAWAETMITNYVVADYGNHRIQLCPAGASRCSTVAGGNGQGSAANQLKNPYALALHLAANGSIANYVIADYGNNRVQLCPAVASTCSTVAGGNGLGNATNQLFGPTGVALHLAANGSIANYVVVDLANFRVQLCPAGASRCSTVAGGNGQGNAANQLNSSFGLALHLAANGSIANYVIADYGNYRVQLCPAGASTCSTVAGGNGAGNASNQLRPFGLALHLAANGSIANYAISDEANHRVQLCPAGASTCSTVAGGNGRGSATNQFNAVRHLALHLADNGSIANVAVIEYTNRRVQLCPAGASMCSTVAGGNGAGNATNQFASPTGLAVTTASITTTTTITVTSTSTTDTSTTTSATTTSTTITNTTTTATTTITVTCTSTTAATTTSTTITNTTTTAATITTRTITTASTTTSPTTLSQSLSTTIANTTVPSGGKTTAIINATTPSGGTTSSITGTTTTTTRSRTSGNSSTTTSSTSATSTTTPSTSLTTKTSTSTTLATFIYPIATWIVGDFPDCNCATPYVTRTLVCSTGNEYACNQTSEPPSTVRVCDVVCTTSPPEVPVLPTTPPEAAKASITAIIVVVVIFVSASLCCCFCIYKRRRPCRGKCKVSLPTSCDNTALPAEVSTISNWSLKKDRKDGKETIVWDVDLQRIGQLMGVNSSLKENDEEVALNIIDEIWCNMVNLAADAGSSPFKLTTVFTTSSNREEDFLCGKAYVEGFAPQTYWSGCAKVLRLQRGVPSFEMPGLGALKGKRPLNDGQWHSVVVRALVADGEGDAETGTADVTATYTLEVDGEVEDEHSFKSNKTTDHPDALWCAGSMPKSSAAAASSSGQSRAGLSARGPAAPDTSFLGEISSITFNGLKVRDPVAEAEVKYLGSPQVRKYTIVVAAAEMKSPRTPKEIAANHHTDGNPAFDQQAEVEYFSATKSQWVLGSITGFREHLHDPGFSLGITYNVQLRRGHMRDGAEMSLIREVMKPGEPISIYNNNRGVWVDARAARTQVVDVCMLGYRVFLQSDIDKHRKPSNNASGKKQLPAVHKISAHLVRRRFLLGAKVLCYQDTQHGWVNATVEKLEAVTCGEQQGTSTGPTGKAEENGLSPPSLGLSSSPEHKKKGTLGKSKFMPIFSDLSIASAASVGSHSTAVSMQTDSSLYPIAMIKPKPTPFRAPMPASLRAAAEKPTPVPLWETATIKLESGEVIVVGTFRLKMESSEWGGESALPIVEEDLAEDAQQGTMVAPLTAGAAAEQALGGAVIVDIEEVHSI